MEINFNFENEDDVLEIIDGYAAATPNGNEHDVLRQWISDHPAYERELLDFAMRRDTVSRWVEEDFPSEQAKAAYLSRIKEIYRQVYVEKSQFEGFLKRLEAMSMKKFDFIEAVGISPGILNSLENRSMEFASIPRRFIARVAEKLSVTVESVSLYLQQPPLAAQFHKNHSRPTEVVKQNFAEAIESDLQLSPEQKKDLLSMGS